jgi:hypothetical protein
MNLNSDQLEIINRLEIINQIIQKPNIRKQNKKDLMGLSVLVNETLAAGKSNLWFELEENIDDPENMLDLIVRFYDRNSYFRHNHFINLNGSVESSLNKILKQLFYHA